MTVELTCMNGHTFGVTPDMVGVVASGTSFKVTCPECNAPAAITHAKVIEVMGLKDNNEARELKKKMAAELREKGVVPKVKSKPKTKVESVKTTVIDEEPDEPDEIEEEEEDSDMTSGDPYSPATGTPWTDASVPFAHRPINAPPPRPTMPPTPAITPRRHAPIDVMGTVGSAKDRNTILRETIEATNLPDATKDRIRKFIGLKPEGLSPHELYSALTYLGVANAPALAVVRSYEFDLSLQQQEVEQERQLYTLLGVPMPEPDRPTSPDYSRGQFPFMQQSAGVAPSPNMAQNPFLTPTSRPSGGGSPGQGENGRAGNKEPQIDIATLLPLAMQNPQLFQMLVSNPQLMQAVAQNPMMLFQMMQMTQGNQTAQAQQAQNGGVSREEVRALISNEMAELKKILTEASGNPRENALAEELRQNRQFMLEIMKGQLAANNNAGRQRDPLAEQQGEILKTLLHNTLDRSNNDGTGVILGALEELKKNQNGLGSGSQSIEGMNLFLRYQELANQMEETRSRFQDEREKRESLKDIVNTAAGTIGETIAGVIQQSVPGLPNASGASGAPGNRPEALGGSLRPRPVQDVEEEAEEYDAPTAPPQSPPAAPPGVNTLACLDCGAPIYVPSDATSATCPKCKKKFGINRTPPPEVPGGAPDGTASPPVDEDVEF